MMADADDERPNGKHLRAAGLARTARLRLRARARRRLSLALQGGGSFGAFTWGVLDGLLKEPGLSLDTVSGTSAGAVNAVLFASGLAEGGPDGARERLERFWTRLSASARLTPFGALGDAALDFSTHVMSPYQFNPLGLDPLRAILAEEVDFERLRRTSPVRLVIAATRVKDGQARLFRTEEITLETVLASACLPRLHHAVEIDGDWYWDGGFTANPPLRPVVIEGEAEDVLIVQILPEEHDDLPRLASEISRRISQIAFNGPLRKEIEALTDLADWCRKERALFPSRLCRKLQRLHLHRIVAEDGVENMHKESALRLDLEFLLRLRQSGERAAQRWLATVPGSAALPAGRRSA